MGWGTGQQANPATPPVVDGIGAVWTTARTGRGHQLLVEADLRHPMRTRDDDLLGPLDPGAAAEPDHLDAVDVVISEVGGTVGDIEILPFLEAIRQFRKDVGRDNVFYIHVTLVPFIGPSAEQKTKPTQHSVTELRSRGIQPDAIVCRSDRPISSHLKEKISQLCDVPERGIVSGMVTGRFDTPRRPFVK